MNPPIYYLGLMLDVSRTSHGLLLLNPFIIVPAAPTADEAIENSILPGRYWPTSLTHSPSWTRGNLKRALVPSPLVQSRVVVQGQFWHYSLIRLRNENGLSIELVPGSLVGGQSKGALLALTEMELSVWNQQIVSTDKLNGSMRRISMFMPGFHNLVY